MLFDGNLKFECKLCGPIVGRLGPASEQLAEVFGNSFYKAQQDYATGPQCPVKVAKL